MIRQYAGKRITGATAGLAYNLGVAHDDITPTGVCAEDVGDGNKDYDFTDRGNYNLGTENLAAYTHHKCLRDDPQTDLA